MFSARYVVFKNEIISVRNRSLAVSLSTESTTSTSILKSTDSTSNTYTVTSAIALDINSFFNFSRVNSPKDSPNVLTAHTLTT